MARIGGVVFVLVGIYTLITADLEQDKDSLYQVTTYQARSGTVISDKVMEGREIIKNKRIGGVCLIGFGAFFVWLFRPPSTATPRPVA